MPIIASSQIQTVWIGKTDRVAIRGSKNCHNPGALADVFPAELHISVGDAMSMSEVKLKICESRITPFRSMLFSFSRMFETTDERVVP